MCYFYGIMIIEDFIALNKLEKLKKKKKKGKMDRYGNDKFIFKKICKKRQFSEFDIESVMYIIEVVAKGDWGIEKFGEFFRKKVRIFLSGKGSILDVKLLKKKVKLREKKTFKEKFLDIIKELRFLDFISIFVSKNIFGEVLEGIKVELLIFMEDVLLFSLSGQVKFEDSDCYRKIEICGFRKFERFCKGVFYKILVFEGMFIFLRVNVDRGK